ncbi:MAG TPA: hypothetical protein VKK79_01940 [Candidatus Lokiarchaeia archaeon]|nr:hypothetical protein [Candidatus Lokiarchaeia archaeon]
MPTPDWDSVRDISSDLRHILDDGEIPADFVPKIARSIALLRDEKVTEHLQENAIECEKVVFRKLI